MAKCENMLGSIKQTKDRMVDKFVEDSERCFCVVVGMMLLLVSLAMVTGSMALSDVEAAWTAVGKESTKAVLMYKEAQSYVDNNGSSSLGETVPYSLRVPTVDQSATFTFHYKSVDGGDIFRPQQLSDVCRLERVLFQHTIFRQYCRRLHTGCAMQAITPLFYGDGNLSAYDWSCTPLSADEVDAKVAEMFSSIRTMKSQSPFAFFMDKDVQQHNFTRLTRSMVPIGYPSEGAQEEYLLEMSKGKSDKDARGSARSHYIGEIQPHLDDVQEAMFKVPDTEMTYGPGGYWSSAYQVDVDQFARVGSIKVRFKVPLHDDMDMIEGDMFFTGVAVIFVFLYMWFHLRSFFIAAMGMFQIMSSLPLATLLYKYVFQVDYFFFLHILSVFVVLGVGADDVFVLVDTWKITASAIIPSRADGTYTTAELKERMRITYRCTASAIFNTSFTTACAFLSCSVSKIMPMRTNGWYAATCIVLNYILTCTLMPTVVIIHYNRLESKRCCCPGWRRRQVREDEGSEKDGKLAVGETPAAATATPLKGSKVAYIINKYYIPIMEWKVMQVRVLPLSLVLILGAVVAQGIHFASQLTMPAAEEVWFPSNHMHNYYQTYARDAYYGKDVDVLARGTLFWGIKGLDVSTANVYNPWQEAGTPIFDEEFDLSKHEAQRAVLQTCADLRVLACNLEACSVGSRGGGTSTLVLQKNNTVSCFLEDFAVWRAAQGLAGGDELPGLPAGTRLPEGPQFLEEIANFRTNATPSDELRDLAAANWITQIGFIEGSLKYASIHFLMTLTEVEVSTKGVQVRDLLSDWTDERRSTSPACASGPRYKAEQFIWYDVAEELIAGFFSAIAIAGPVAFLVLLFVTRNVLVALLAVSSVSASVICVLGIVIPSSPSRIMYYDLGISESIAGVIVIGLSVDYRVVYLAHMYVEASKQGETTRIARASYAIRNMGATVLAGGVTTMGASTVMFLCFSPFFHKMAVYLVYAILYSWLFTVGFFMSMLFLIGPEGSCGDLGSIASYAWDCVTMRGSQREVRC